MLIYTNDSDNHMLDMVQTVSTMNVSVDGIKIVDKEERAIYELSCYVTGLEQLEKLIVAIEKNSFVEKAERAFR